jgi:hypothetical protein
MRTAKVFLPRSHVGLTTHFDILDQTLDNIFQLFVLLFESDISVVLLLGQLMRCNFQERVKRGTKRGWLLEGTEGSEGIDGLA